MLVPESPADRLRVAEAYERLLVPAWFTPWALDLLETAALEPGERVLDVACGTGIVARLAASRVGSAGQVVALDVNEAMLAVARAQPTPAGCPIEWREGNARALAFPPQAFDAALCQQGLQFMPEHALVVTQMQRVVRARGRLVLSVYSRSEGHTVLEQAVAPFIGAQSAAVLREPLALADRERLAWLFGRFGFRTVEIETRARTVHFAAADDFLTYQLLGPLAPAVDPLPAEQRAALEAAGRDALAPYRDGDGLGLPVEAHVVVARP
jgi:SAM-dependent methyltransferase